MKRNTFILLSLGFIQLSACSDSSTTARFKVVGGNAVATSNSLTRAVASGIGGAKSMSVPVWSLYLSPNKDCTGATKIKTNTTAQAVDFYAVNSTMFEENPAAGTYECMIMEIEDVFSFKPDSTAISASSGVCADQSYYLDIYRTDSGDTWHDIDGHAITPTGSNGVLGSDRVFVYASTDSTAPTTGSIGADPHQIISISSPITIVENQQKVMTFKINSSDRVTVDGGECGLQPVAFSIE